MDECCSGSLEGFPRGKSLKPVRGELFILCSCSTNFVIVGLISVSGSISTKSVIMKSSSCCLRRNAGPVSQLD